MNKSSLVICGLGMFLWCSPGLAENPTRPFATTPDSSRQQAPAQPGYGYYGPYRGSPPPGYYPPRYNPPPTPLPPLRVQREYQSDAYVVKIFLDNRSASDIQINTSGNRWLIVETQGEQRQQSSERQRPFSTTPPGGSYQYQNDYQYQSRRLSLPPDADFGKMRRTDHGDLIELVIPRR